LLVVENASIGWSTIQTILERGYQNFYHSPKSGEIKADSYFNEYSDTTKMTPGFTMNSRTRPICINKFQESISDKGVIFQSKRLISEMKTFVWKNGKAQAQSGYNDDLVMAFSIGQYVRSTALQFNKYGEDIYKSMLRSATSNTITYKGGYSANSQDNPYQIDNPYTNGKEDIRWLL